jgi:hypothetical protein
MPLERAALERGGHDEDLGAGLYSARFDTGGLGRDGRDCAAKVEACERHTAAAERVLVTRCLKHRRPPPCELPGFCRA